MVHACTVEWGTACKEHFLPLAPLDAVVLERGCPAAQPGWLVLVQQHGFGIHESSANGCCDLLACLLACPAGSLQQRY